MMSITWRHFSFTILLFFCIASFSGCGIQKGTQPDIKDVTLPEGMEYPLTIGDYKIPMEEYRYYFLTEKRTEEANYGGSEVWQNEDALDRLKSVVVSALQRRYVIKKIAEDMGVVLSEADIAVIDEAVRDKTAELGGEVAFNAWLTENYMSLDQFRSLREAEIIQRKIRDVMESSGSEYFADLPGLLDRLNKTYVKVAQIRLGNGDGDSGEKYDLANELRTRALAGEDFDELVRLYSEDPEKDGRPVHVFTLDETPPTYEDTAFDLGIGEISEVFLSQGYLYVLKRLAFTEEETEELLPGIEASWYDVGYGNLFFETRESMPVTFDPDYDLISIDNIG